MYPKFRKTIALLCAVTIFLSGITEACAIGAQEQLSTQTNDAETEAFTQGITLEAQKSLDVLNSGNNFKLDLQEKIATWGLLASVQNPDFLPVDLELNIRNVEKFNLEFEGSKSLEIITEHPEGSRITSHIPSVASSAALPEGQNLRIVGTNIMMDHSNGVVTLKGSGTVPTNCFSGYENSVRILNITGNVAVGDASFAYLPKLTTVNITSTASSVGIAAFLGCSALTSVSIPSNVTRLEEGAFHSCTSLQSITLPPSVQYIGNYTFYACSSLTGFFAPGVTEFGAGVFACCSALTEFVMPERLAVTGGDTFYQCKGLETVELSPVLTQIGAFDFYECIALREIMIPDSVTQIGEGAFYYCEALTNIDFPSEYVDVGSFAFSFCNNAQTVSEAIYLRNVGDQAFIATNIPGEIVFSADTTYIGAAAFQGCKVLHSIDFQNAVLAVNDYAFFDCPNLTEVNNSPTYSAVGEAAFHLCPGIESVSFSSDCTYIGSGCFYGCSNLKYAVFNDSSAAIGIAAFYQCSALEEIVISKNCPDIESAAFYQCTALSEIDFSGATLEIADHVFTFCESLTEIKNENAVTGIGAYAFCRTALTDASGFDSIEKIGVSAFGHCSALERATLPENITTIPESLFFGCKNLSQLALHDSVEVIDSYAFTLCTSLVLTALPDRLTKIGEGAFAECDAITQLRLPDALITIEDHGFSQCDNLATLSGGEKVQSIGMQAFSWCVSLTEAHFPGAFTIGTHAFNCCKSLKTVSLGNQLELLENGLFAECRALTSFTIPKTVKMIGNSAFYQCESLEIVVLPAGLESIDVAAFYGCSSLTEIDVPDSVCSVGGSCFKDCSSLERVILPERLEVIADGTFFGCKALVDVEMPQYLKEVGYAAFYECESLNAIEFASTLTKISSHAFTYCTSLQDVELPKAVQSVGECAFAFCSNLARATLPLLISEVSKYLFYCCSALEEVRCYGNIVSIGTGAFYDCKALKNLYLYGGTPVLIGDQSFSGVPEDITLHSSALNRDWTVPEWTGPDGNVYHTEKIDPIISGTFADDLNWHYYSESGSLVISGKGRMEDYASEADTPWYSYINDIHSIHINDGVTYIGERSFANCSILRSVYMDDSVTECGVYAFAKCQDLVYVDLSNNLNRIGKYAFYECRNLADIMLPFSLTEIGQYAFFGCSAIQGITIPDKVEFLGEGAFYNCTGLREVGIIAELSEVEDYAFKGCSELTNVFLGNEVNKIGKSAFADCAKLTYVCISGKAVEIEDYAFNQCSELDTIIFTTEKPKSVGYRAFYGTPDELEVSLSQEAGTESVIETKDGRKLACNKVSPSATGDCGETTQWSFWDETGVLFVNGTEAIDDCVDNAAPWHEIQNEIRYVIISDGVQSIGANAFAHCSQLTKIALPDGLTHIGEGAFADCSSLRYAELPDSLQSLGKNAFYQCGSLVGVRIPGSLTNIPEYTFAMCDHMEMVEIASGVESISYSAFYNCSSLRIVHLPDTVTQIQDWAFARCTKLENIAVPNVTALGEFVFFACESLHEAVALQNLSAIPAYCYAGTAVSEVSVPEEIEVIGEGAFWGCAQLQKIDLGSVREIGAMAFSETALTTVTIPAQTEKIGEHAFGQCSLLQEFSVSENNTLYCSVDGILYSQNGERLVQYPIGRQDTSFTVPASVKKIGVGAFYGSVLKQITLDENTAEVEAAAFANSKQLEEIEIPGSAAVISENAFRYCSALEIVRFGAGTPLQIGESAFADTADNLRFVVLNAEAGWTYPQWTGPDGVVYTVEVIENVPYTLVAGDVVYHESKEALECVVYFSNNVQIDMDAELLIAVYQSNQMIAVEKQAVRLDAQTQYQTGFVLTGGMALDTAEDWSVKLFLLEEKTHTPLAASVCVPLQHTLTGDVPLCIEIFPISVCLSNMAMKKDSLQTTAEASESSLLTVAMQLTHQDLDNLISQAARNFVAGIDFTVLCAIDNMKISRQYSTDINFTGFDSFFGYVASGVQVQNPGMSYELQQEGSLPITYTSVQISAESRRAIDLDSREPSNIVISNKRANSSEFNIQYDGENLVSIRAIGYAATGETSASEWYEDGTFAFVVPYNGANLLVKVDPKTLVDTLTCSDMVKDSAATLCEYDLALQVIDETGMPVTLGRLEISTDLQNGTVQNVSLSERAQLVENVLDRTYNPIRYDESIDATEDMAAEVRNISPAKGSNGVVTIRLEGTRLEAGAKVTLSGEQGIIPAKDIYYFNHSKLYATFDLSDAADGVYQLSVDQSNNVACTQTFTVDSTLPKGELRASINIDKSVKPGSEYSGSVTYTNTGYTDVYAPVVLIDCGNIEIKGEGSDTFTVQETVFIPNEEGLAGIIANGETAAYNFTYRIKTSNGFVMNVYNYADITENVAEPIVLTDESTASDILNYNMFELTGIRACDYAANIAKMACAQASLGENILELDNLRNAYISAAQGTLGGDTLVGVTDIASRDLSLNRYYFTDVTSHDLEGLWGPGWFSDYDVTAEYHAAEGDAESSIILKNATGLAIYTLKDGVYTEIAYGRSTAVNTENGIIVTYEDGSSVSFNNEGKLCAMSSPHGNTLNLLYNESGELTEVKSDTGDSLIFTYTDGHVSSAESSVTGLQVEYYYSEDRLIGVIDAFDKVLYSYDGYEDAIRKNLLTKITSQTGAYQEFAYDELGRVIAISDKDGSTTYDYLGENVVEVTSPTGDVSTLYFNAAGKLSRMVDAAGKVIESQYSDMLLNSGDNYGLFNQIKYEYDDKYNLTRITDADGNSVSYDHDAKGNVTKVTDRAGVSTAYERNTVGDVRKLVYADGKYESFTYDSRGNITSAVKRDGTTVSYSYDEYSQLTEVVYSTGETVQYTYDERGNIIGIVENGAATTMAYNLKGELTQIKYADGKAIAYTYDEFGRLTSTVSTYGGTGISHFYEYDTQGRLTNVNFGAADFVTYEYNADDSIKRQTNYNGTYTDYSYEAGYLKEIRNCKADGTVISFFRYTYDDLGNISSVTDNTGTWTYGYDKQGQLTRAVSPEGETTVYTYDLSGNRTSVVTRDSMVNYSSNEMNQYTSAGSAQLEYDANGNLISRTDEKGETQYVYDYLDRLVQVTQPDGTVTSYTYDAFGGRSSVTVNGETMQYLNSPTGEGYPLVSYSATSVDTFYIQGNGMAGQIRYNPETDELLYYGFAYNHLGSTTEITDENQNVVNRYTYDEAGNVISSIEGIENNLTYVGKYGITDDGNGLYYARARYISADTMSFISIDPIGQDGDLNVYRYAGNNPVNCVDVTGCTLVIAAALPQSVQILMGVAATLGEIGPAAAAFLATPAGAVVMTVGVVVVGVGVLYSIGRIGGGGGPYFPSGGRNSQSPNNGNNNDESIFITYVKAEGTRRAMEEGVKNAGAYYGSIAATFAKVWRGFVLKLRNLKKVIGKDTTNAVLATAAIGQTAEANAMEAGAVLKGYVCNNVYNSNITIGGETYNVPTQTGIPAMTEGLRKYMQANNIPFDENFTILESTGNSLVLGPADFNTPGSEWGGLVGLIGNWFGWF